MTLHIGGFEGPAAISVRATGAVTFDEARHTLAELMDDGRIVPGTTLLVDARGTTRALTAGELASVAFHFRALFARGVKRLALVTDDGDVEAAAKIFGAFVSTVGATARAFRDLAEAKAWALEGPGARP